MAAPNTDSTTNLLVNPDAPAAFSVSDELLAAENDLKDKFLNMYSVYTGNIGKACAYLEIRRERVRKWETLDSDFAARKDAIRQAHIDGIESNLFEIAEDPEQPGGARVAASKLILEAYRRETYKPDNTGGQTNQIVINLFKKPEDGDRPIEIKAARVK